MSMTEEEWAELLIELYTEGYNDGRKDDDYDQITRTPLAIAERVRDIINSTPSTLPAESD